MKLISALKKHLKKRSIIYFPKEIYIAIHIILHSKEFHQPETILHTGVLKHIHSTKNNQQNRPERLGNWTHIEEISQVRLLDNVWCITWWGEPTSISETKDTPGIQMAKWIDCSDTYLLNYALFVRDLPWGYLHKHDATIDGE